MTITKAIKRSIARIITFSLLIACGTLQAQPTLSDAQVKRLVETACTQCHSMKPIEMLRDGIGGWKGYVEEMVLRGAQIKPEEIEIVVGYLVRHYGPGPEPMSTGLLPPNSVVGDLVQSNEISLPEGQGKALIESRCVLCHDLGRVVTTRRSRDEWQRITTNMITRGISASPSEIDEMVAYLIQHLGADNDK